MASIVVDIPDKYIDLLEDIALAHKCGSVGEFLSKEAIMIAEENAPIFGRYPVTMERVVNEDGGYDG